MMITNPAFRPEPAATVNITAGTATGKVQLQSAPTSRHVRVYNSGTADAFIEFGGSAVTAATTTGMPVKAGETHIFASGEEYVAAITGSGSAKLYLTPGEGNSP